jgi:hypothetical protein
MEQGHVITPQHHPTFKRDGGNPESTNPQFKHAGGMDRNDIDKEFAEAKWVVLTSSQPV